MGEKGQCKVFWSQSNPNPWKDIDKCEEECELKGFSSFIGKRVYVSYHNCEYKLKFKLQRRDHVQPAVQPPLEGLGLPDGNGPGRLLDVLKLLGALKQRIKPELFKIYNRLISSCQSNSLNLAGPTGLNGLNAPERVVVVFNIVRGLVTKIVLKITKQDSISLGIKSLEAVLRFSVQ